MSAVVRSVVLSLRGGDFELTTGQDFSIGSLSQDAEQLRRHIEESFTSGTSRRTLRCTSCPAPGRGRNEP
jgi:uncharacterized linocin/CFP29 family protein